MRNRVWTAPMGAALSLTALLGLSTCAGVAAAEPEASVASAVLAVREYGPTVHPNVYAGVDTSDARGVEVLVVYLTTDDAQIQADFVADSGLAADAVVFRTVPYSEARLAEIDTRLRSDYEALRAEGFDVRGWGIAIDRTAEEVIVPHATPEQLNTLAERYGPGLTVIDDPAPVETKSFVLPLVDGELSAK